MLATALRWITKGRQVVQNAVTLKHPTTLWSCFIYLVWAGLPTAVSFTSSTLSNTLAFAFVGAYNDPDVQAGHGLGYSIGNVLILTVSLGLISGMDTLCPLAIGSGHREGCWAHLFQALTVVTFVTPLLLPCILFSETLLLLLKQDAIVAQLAGKYLVAGLPGLFFVSTFEAARKFLVFHGFIFAHTFIALCSIPVQVFFLHLFVGVLHRGAVGAGLARSCTWSLIALSIYAYIVWNRHKFGWTEYLQSRPRRQLKRNLSASSTSTVASNQPVTTDQPNITQSVQVSAEAQRPTVVDETLTETDLLESSSNSASLSDVGGSKVSGWPSYCTPAVVTVSRTAALPEALRRHSTDEAGKNHSNTSGAECENTLTAALPTTDAREHHHSTTPQRVSIQFDQHWWEGIPYFLRVAIPSAFLCIFEWVSFEAQIFLVAYLGSAELSALAASASLGSLLFILSMSVSITLNAELGRAMGGGRYKDGRTLGYAGFVMAFCVSIPLALGVLALRPWIARLYSRTPTVQKILQRNLLPQAAIIILDALHVILGGEIKALNLQWFGCIFDGIGLLGVMQIVGIFLAFNTSLFGEGFLIAMAGLTCNVTGYCVLLFCTIDWRKQSNQLTEQTLKRQSIA